MEDVGMKPGSCGDKTRLHLVKTSRRGLLRPYKTCGLWGRAVLCGGRRAARAQSSPGARRRPPHSSRHSAGDMEHFIEAVRRYPCLWDTAAPEYRDQELKDAAWADLVKDTDLTSGTPRLSHL
ncbi:unnamed protein product [Pieris brassicae]|uniref:MADF domain-containing protein n=1 Tax=Pieris brassicae TaxID=7116 RepID=A0A9P0XD00_PIEBR|nr:unnamed protein product [Pieris brassicae]